VTFVPTQVLEVRAWGERVGALAYDHPTGFYAFEYADSWRDGPVELAPLHMPNQRGPFVFPELSTQTYYRLPALVADCLPDRFGNALITAKLTSEGIAETDIGPLDRLAYLGDRAMGALEFHPPVAVDATELTAIQLADLVVAARQTVAGDFSSEGAITDALQQLIQVGISAGGARAKAVICYHPGTQQMRSGHIPPPEGFEHWLIKLDGVDQTATGVETLGSGEGFTRVEYAYYLMATAAGLDMMPSRLLAEGDRSHFLTKRYDRRDDGSRLHAQTLCALDHLDFNLARVHDYSQYLAVVDELDLGVAAREQAFRRVAFNVAAVNCDDHTKNLSFLCDESGTWSLARAYDVTFAYNPQGAWTSAHQMSVGGKFTGVDLQDLLTLADRFAVPAPADAIDQVAAAVGRWPDFAEQAGVAEDRARAIGDTIERVGLAAA
jgi:serine/threonine-protein kinase HipA